MQLVKPSYKISAIVLISIAVGFVFLQWINETAVSPTTSISEQPDRPDYFMENFTLIETRDNGEPFRWLSGSQLTHYADGDTKLDHPNLKLLGKNQQLWIANAHNGLIDENQNLTLDGSVQIEQVSGNFQQINIQTQSLMVSLQDQIARSNKRVSLKTDNGSITAIGMVIDMAEHNVQLLSAVKARYAAD